MSFPRYPAYKAAGVQWLVEVPSHWIGPKKIGDVSSLKGRLGWQGLKADEYREEGPLVVSSAHFSNFKIRWSECPHVSGERYELDANIQLSVEDILLMKDGAALGKLAYVDELPDAACLNSHLLLFRPLQDGHSQAFIPKFAFYYMQSSLFQEFMQTRGTGATFMGVSQATIARHLVHWPQLEEQRTIASFLEREAAKIDALVAEQQRLISLLKEKRQAAISHTVTKGLDPSVPMKDSGIEWLGKVPAHWKLRPLKAVVKFRSGGTPDKRISEYWDGEVPWVSAKDLKAECLADSIDHITQHALDKGAASLVPADAVVVVVRGMILARLFPVSQLMVPMAINQDLKAVLPGLDVSAKYLAWLLRASEPETLNCLDEAGHGTKALRMENWEGLIVPVPPISEQQAIASMISNATSRIDQLVSEAVLSIELLGERRSALITAAVTGQIDVRGVQ